MTIFAILLPVRQPAIVEAIKEAYPDNWFSLNDTQYLISAPGTVLDVTAKIGIADVNDKQKPSLGTGIVFATSSYYGRAPATVWDWVKAKLESG